MGEESTSSSTGPPAVETPPAAPAAPAVPAAPVAPPAQSTEPPTYVKGLLDVIAAQNAKLDALPEKIAAGIKEAMPQPAARKSAPAAPAASAPAAPAPETQPGGKSEPSTGKAKGFWGWYHGT